MSDAPEKLNSISLWIGFDLQEEGHLQSAKEQFPWTYGNKSLIEMGEGANDK